MLRQPSYRYFTLGKLQAVSDLISRRALAHGCWRKPDANACRLMLRKPFLAIVTTLAVGLATVTAHAQQAEGEKLPVERIVLFNSGVGFFEHRGEVEGDDSIELKFKTDDINDLLKSLVLQDLGGGQISTVSYGSRDPITKTLKTFAIDLTNKPTLFNLMVQVRGQELIVHAPHEVRGVMVGAESRPLAVPGGEPIKTDYINLLTDEGLQTFALSSIARIQMANAELEREFRAALKTLAAAQATDKKTVTLDFVGQGKRPVRVGYIRQAPVWKTSYRLVMSDDEAPHLQGWAIVENTGDVDWQNVELSLVSGRPISFVMDLYSPLYAPRPQVAHELFTSLGPQEYEQSLDELQNESLPASSMPSEGRSLGRRSRRGSAMSTPAFGGRGGLGGGGGYGGEMAGVVSDGSGLTGDFDKHGEFDIAKGIASIAEASDVGELFRYDIAMPVSLKRQRSAMLPIVNQPVEATKVSIYDPAVHAKHPLNGIRLKNTSELHLMQGPITLFDGGVYAGDGKIAALPAGEERLVSYALDLDVEVAPTRKPAANKLVSVILVDGMLHAKQHYLRTWQYKIKNSGDKAKSVLVEHPQREGWKLVDPDQASETTRDRHRFAVEVEPGQTTELTVDERREIKQTINLVDFNDKRYSFYLSAKQVDPEVKAALAEYQRRRAEITKLAQQRQQHQGRLALIENEQARIRKNMQQLPRDSELYKRYIKKFTEQEDAVEQLNTDVQRINKAILQKENELREHVKQLEVG